MCRRCARGGGGQQTNGSLCRTCCCPLSSATGDHDTWTMCSHIVFAVYAEWTRRCVHGVRHQVWNWKVPLSSTSEIIFPLNLESGTFVMQALMSFYPLRVSPIIISIAHTASETDSGGEMSNPAKSVFGIWQVKWLFPPIFYHSENKFGFFIHVCAVVCSALGEYWLHVCAFASATLNSPDMFLFGVELCLFGI